MEACNFAALKKCIAPICGLERFSNTVYCLIFLPGRPVVSVTFPIAVCSAYQVLTIVNKHFSHLEVYQRAGGSRLFAYTEKNMHRAMMMCATMENSLLPVVLAELLTPARSVSKVMMLVNLLRSRYANARIIQCSASSTRALQHGLLSPAVREHDRREDGADRRAFGTGQRSGWRAEAVVHRGTAGGPKDKPQ